MNRGNFPGRKQKKREEAKKRASNRKPDPFRNLLGSPEKYQIKNRKCSRCEQTFRMTASQIKDHANACSSL